MRKLCSALGAACLIVSLASIASADDRSDARDHFMKGSKFFDLGKFDEAIKEYEAAYTLRDEPVLLYNIAQAHRLAGHASQAMHFYKSYLHRSPKAPNREEVENKIAELEKLVQQQQITQTLPPDQPISPGDKPAATASKPKPTTTTPSKPPEVAAATKPTTPPPTAVEPPPPPVVETPPATSPETPPVATTPPPEEPKPAGPGFFGGPGKMKKIIGIALLGVGVACLAVGGAMSALAVGAGNDVVGEANSGQRFDPSKESAGKTDQIVGGVMYGVGGAAAVVGGVMLYLGIRQDKNAASTHAMIVPVISPTQAGASLQLRF
jgi:hypothetical protein